MVLVVGASNQWFAQSLSALAVPQVGASALQAKVEQLWDDLQNMREPAVGYGISLNARPFGYMEDPSALTTNVHRVHDIPRYVLPHSIM
jgi:hypothetical protein